MQEDLKMEQKNLVIVRGGGDLASGVIYKLYQCGYRILILECERPSAIRREVAFCDAVYDGVKEVEGVLCQRISTAEECEHVWKQGEIPLIVDEKASVTSQLHPAVLIDAILAKKNLGTSKDMAPVTIALGPGFEAGKHTHFVVETKRGHNLGRIIKNGSAIPNTGIPGIIGGYGKERVIHSPASGRIHNISQIADFVEKGQMIAMVDETPVTASLTGVLRGIIHDGYEVFQGMKIADIDPRKEEKQNCFTISDKARCIAGGVLEILLSKGVLP